MNKTGYKEMLRDRMPYVVNLALKYCKSKERWINHVYNTQIGIYTNKSDRDYATRCVLGIAKRHPSFDFDDTIDWNDLSEEDTKMWKIVSSWVKWFQSKHAVIENLYNTHKIVEDDETIRKIIKRCYLNTLTEKTQEELSIFLMKSFQP